MKGPVVDRVAQGGIVVLAIGEALERRHLDVVLSDAVAGVPATVADGGVVGGKELLCVRDALNRIDLRGGQRIEVRRQTLDLLHVVHGVALHEGDILERASRGVSMLPQLDDILPAGIETHGHLLIQRMHDAEHFLRSRNCGVLRVLQISSIKIFSLSVIFFGPREIFHHHLLTKQCRLTV